MLSKFLWIVLEVCFNHYMYHSLGRFSRRQIDYIFLIFPIWDNLYENLFSGNKYQNYFNISSAENFLQNAKHWITIWIMTQNNTEYTRACSMAVSLIQFFFVRASVVFRPITPTFGNLPWQFSHSLQVYTCIQSLTTISVSRLFGSVVGALDVYPGRLGSNPTIDGIFLSAYYDFRVTCSISDNCVRMSTLWLVVRALDFYPGRLFVLIMFFGASWRLCHVSVVFSGYLHLYFQILFSERVCLRSSRKHAYIILTPLNPTFIL